MAHISSDVIEKTRQMDLLTYLQVYEPGELVHVAGNTYCTREHDSLKISNGKWFWFSRGIGGYSALDYLIKVKEIPFPQAVETLTGHSFSYPPSAKHPQKPKMKTVLLPRASPDSSKVYRYLMSRGIDPVLIDFCLQTGRLYESLPYHNAVFVGLDRYNKPRYANLRGINSSFKGEASGSDKRFSFNIPASNSTTVHLFESAIDLLSYASLEHMAGRTWNRDHLLSLAGVYRPKKELQPSSFPLALKQYLSDHPEIKRIILRLDNDTAGRYASEALQQMLSKQFDAQIEPPPSGKDYNDYLCIKKGIPITKSKERNHER